MDPDRPAYVPNRPGVPKSGDVAYIFGWPREANPHPAEFPAEAEWTADWDFQKRVHEELIASCPTWAPA